jgi:hypothetical protein
MENESKSADQATGTIDDESNGTDVSIDIDVKVGILHTIANAIYATPAGKVREAVANAIDNEATWILIVADQTTNTICIFDNGRGIPVTRFQEIFKSIGYGLLSTIPETKLSFFGLGLMSIFQLGMRTKIFTSPKGQKTKVGLLVEADNFFKEDNRNKSIKDLKGFVKFIDPSERRSSSAPLLDDYIEREFAGLPPSFTEIVIEEVKEEDMNAICSSVFMDELRKVLPLKVEADEPFLKRFTGIKSGELRDLLDNKTFCRTIDVFFGIRGEGTEEDPEAYISQLYKYFPRFRSDINFPDANVYVGNPSDGDFGYYIVHTIAEDLHREKKDEKENGFWVRNQNFLVKAADFLQKPGPGRPLIDQPLRNWIFGEIFHKDMNRFLTVSRTEFLFEDKCFRDFREAVIGIVRPLNQILRQIWEWKDKVVEGVIRPFEKIFEVGGPLQATEQRLRRMVDPQDGEEFYKTMLQRLNGQRSKEIEDPEARVDVLLPKTLDPIVLGEDRELLVCVDPKVTGEHYEVSWDNERKTVKVSISPELFKPRDVVFLGKTFTLVFVAKAQTDPGVSIDVDGCWIYVNPFNKELSLYSVSILDILIALEVAYASSQDKDELKMNFLTLIGAKPIPALEYVVPLGDELRRAYAFSGKGA